MIIGNNDNRYEWVDNWAKVPDSQSAREGWAHHGMAVTSHGHIVGFHPGNPTVLIFDGEGEVVSTWDAPVREAHQFALEVNENDEFLWIADPGRKSMKANGTYEPVEG
ncbi:MAG: hypothetical protein IH867_12010, partial [Chloroflexi bacterium]|nr:hypothetical protein [Chloroflexota bacterium]